MIPSALPGPAPAAAPPRAATASQPAQQLGLLNGLGLPLAAPITVGEVLIDPRGGDGFTLPVDAGRQRLPSCVAIHMSIVAHDGRLVPVIGLSARGNQTPPRDDQSSCGSPRVN